MLLFNNGDLMNEDSILLSIKKMLGINNQDSDFDLDLAVNINSIFSTLYQIGVGQKGHYTIKSSEDKWIEVFKDCEDLIDFIKLYTYMKTRMVFDPPTSSTLSDSLNKQIAEIEWRIQIQAESSDYFNSCDCDEDAIPDSVIEGLWNEIMNS